MNEFIGDPEFQDEFYEQQDTNYSCAVAGQVSIINQYLDAIGEDGISEGEALYVAHQNGWVSEGGTSIENMSRLMEHAGIPCHHMHNASAQDLALELQQGHRVMVAVDADELWADNSVLSQFYQWFQEAFGLDTSDFNPANHAVVVTGINNNAEPPTVIINDSGDPDGQSKEYPLDEFMDAWENSDFHYVATDMSPDTAVAAGEDDTYLDELVGAAAGVTVFCQTGDLNLASAAYAASNKLTDFGIDAYTSISSSDTPVETALAVGVNIYSYVESHPEIQDFFVESVDALLDFV